MKKFLFAIILVGSFPCFSKAQIIPPDFLCVKGDSLFWDLPANSCGPFLSYDIFTSDNSNGPYTLLTSITDPLIDFFHHPNPAGLQQYYYLVSNFDCPGQVQLTSDTLDSRPPEVSPLKSITVQGTDILLNWQASPSPEVFAHIIYRRDPIGVIPIDTVFGMVTTYTDPNAEPDMESEGYFVNALDRCGSTSIFDQEHKTIFLEGTPTNCSVELNWNLYQGWNAGTASQEVWVSVNGNAPFMFKSLGGSVSSFDFRDVNDGDSYCFFLQAIENGSGETSRSNEICFATLPFSQPVNELYISNVSVGANNSVTVDWGINANADLELLEIFRNDTSGFLEIANTELPTSPLPVSNQFLDVNADAGNGPLTYQVHALDSCGNELATAPATTIFLTGNSLDLSTSQLNWTPFLIDNGFVDEYKIIRFVNGSETVIGSVPGSQLSFEDAFDLNAIGSGTICYFIQARGDIAFPNGTSINFVSRSNIACLDQAIRIFTPNALAPDGFNQEFKPVILSGNIAQYEMQIFDRYGSIVFSADSPSEAWKGKRDGKKLPQGVYIFRIYLKLENGKEAEKKGHVLLLR